MILLKTFLCCDSDIVTLDITHVATDEAQRP
jgi:hypothetical protein